MCVRCVAAIRAVPGENGAWAVWIDDSPTPDARFCCTLDAVAYCETLVDRGRVGSVTLPSGMGISAWGCGSHHPE